GFSVCSHPTCVENGPQHETIHLGHEDSDNSMVGMKVWMHLQSDSGVDEDLTEVDEREHVSPNGHFTGALHHAPPPPGVSGWQGATEVQPDRHRLRVDVINALNQTQLQGNPGGWANDQLDAFRCCRCGMAHPAVIRRSGYRLTRDIFTVPGVGL